MSDNFLDDTWGNRAPAEIHNPKLNRRRTKAEYAKISEKVSHAWQDPARQAKASARSKKSNLANYSVGTYIVRSPGNDLFDFYDHMHAAAFANESNITPVPPSRIFQFRYRTELPDTHGANHASGPTHTSIFREICAPYADNFSSVRISNDKNNLYKWLVDKPSVQKEFKLGMHAVEYLSEIKGKPQRGLRITVHCDNPIFEEMFWRGPLAGWSIVFIPD